MQKILWIVALLTLGNAQELTPAQASKLRNYDHSLSGKIRYKRLLQQTALISKQRAYEVAEQECKAKPYKAKLQVRFNRLFYTVYTDSGYIKIDALDGEIMQKCEQK